MSEAHRCPRCGCMLDADAPEGLCPRCLVQQAMAEPTPNPSPDPGPTGHGPADAPTAADPEATADVRPTRPPGEATTQGDFANGDGLPAGTAVGYFGDYEVRRELGRGGMGVVYEARQVSLNRRVALKMLRAGLLAGDEELRRFRNEAEAVALLDHPGVVPVYEVGAHQGQPYFSMKLVEGGSLVPLLDRYQDDPKAAARLVVEAAEAVAHAHARGILHRDLKPANILIDAEGHPHVTDFGLSKHVEADVEMTASGAILGTPAYMSPEQANGHRGGITTASDVYGLGAILYACLTGRAPFGGGSVIETLDAVRTRPPEPPTQLNTRTPRDLETICLKCLEKDPRRRYASAHDLAADLNNWLDSRPILARRVRPAERAWLWCKRRPAIAALSAATLLALVGGTTTVIVVQARANSQLKAANAKVEARYKLAVAAIETFHTGVSEDFLLKEERFKVLRDRLLNSAADFYEKLGALLKDDTDTPSRRALLQANFEVAELADKVGRKEHALALHRRVLAGRESLESRSKDDPELASDVAQSLLAIGRELEELGRIDEALVSFVRARSAVAAGGGGPRESDVARSAFATAQQRVGALLSTTGRTTEALAAYETALAIRGELVEANPDDTDFRSNLAESHDSIGKLRWETGQLAEALASHRRALEIRTELSQADAADPEFLIRLAESHYNIGNLQAESGQLAEALESHRRALEIRDELYVANPAVTEFRARLAESQHLIGLLQSQTGRLAEALESYRRAVAIREQLAEANPAVTEFHASLALSLSNMGDVQALTGQLTEALASHRRALAIQGVLAAANPDVTEFRSRLAVILYRIGQLQSRTGRWVEALESHRRALEIRDELAAANRDVTEFRTRLAESYTIIAELQSQAGELAEALESYRRALEIRGERTAASPDVTEFRSRLANSHQLIGVLLRAMGKPAEAMTAHETSRGIREKLVEASPQDTLDRWWLAATRTSTACLLREQGRVAEAIAVFDSAIALGEPLARESPSDTFYQAGHAASRRGRGLARLDLGDLTGTVADTRHALEIWDGLPTRDGEGWFETACCHATLSALAGRDGSGVPAADGPAEAETAMALLRKSAGMGYRSPAAYRIESALDVLRDREDFRLLMMDLAFPAGPFAP